MFNPPIVTTTTLLAARYVQAISPHRNYIPQIVILSGTTLRVTPALFPPPTYIMLTTPLTPSSTSSFHPFALFPSFPHLCFPISKQNETKQKGNERYRMIKGGKRGEGLSVGRAERRPSPCVTRVCERASISASHRLTSPPLTAVSVLTEHRVEKGINRSGRYWGREK